MACPHPSEFLGPVLPCAAAHETEANLRVNPFQDRQGLGTVKYGHVHIDQDKRDGAVLAR